MKSYELNKKDNVSGDKELQLTLLLKTYFKSLSDSELTNICEDIVTKFNENKQLEKLKNLKKLLIFNKQETKRQLLKTFKEWRSKVTLMNFVDNTLLNRHNQLITNEEPNKNFALNDSRMNSSHMENRIKKISKIILIFFSS